MRVKAISSRGHVSDIDQAALRFAAGRDACLCTIVGIDGSFSRRVGAQFAVSADGQSAGSLSDGCLEAELTSQAMAAKAEGLPRLLRYGHGSAFVDFRLPCGAGIDVLVDPAPDRHALSDVVAALEARQPAQLALPVSPTSRVMRHRTYVPACRLIILGAGAEATELAALAKAYGLEVEMGGPETGLAMGRAPQAVAVDPWTAVLLLFHDHDWEAPLLEWGLASPAFYLGAIGGQKARAQRREMLMEKGVPAADLARLHSPVGLIPQARDPRTLALSVLAEVIQAYEMLR